MLETELRAMRLIRPVRVAKTTYRSTPFSNSCLLMSMIALIFSVSPTASTLATGTPRLLRWASALSSYAVTENTRPLFVKNSNLVWVSTTRMCFTASSSRLFMLTTPLPPRCWLR